MKKLLITGGWNCSSRDLDLIKSMGYEIYFLQNEKDEIPSTWYQVEGIICNGLFLYHPIEKFVNLEYIQLTSAGYDRVPMKYIKEKKITINNARGVYSIPMAEFVLSNVLALYKNTYFFYENQKKHKWEKNREINELYGKNVLIIGAGNIGTECAKRFCAFGTNVVGIDLFESKNEFYRKILSISSLNDELRKADIVLVTLPLTEETYHLLNSQNLNCMKNDAILVNISRGGIIDEEALIDVLEKKKIGGAILDVFENEPLISKSKLWDLDNVIVSPHNSFVGDGNLSRLTSIIIKNLEEIE